MVVKIIFFAVAVLVLSLNALPNHYALIKTPPGQVFSGQASWFDPWDINVYVAAINQGQSGSVLLHNSYTTILHSPILYYPFYTIIGFILPKINSFFLFHLLAGAVGLLLTLVIWKTAGFFLGSKKETLLATLLISLGGGLGWLFFPEIKSADLFMTGFTFASHFQRPHEGLAVALYLLSLGFFYLAIEKKLFRLNLFSLIALIPLLIFYPFYILSFALIEGTYAFSVYLRQGKTFPLFFTLVNVTAGGVVALIYTLYLKANPVFGGVTAQTLSTPTIPEILLGYGALLPITAYQIRRGKSRGKLFLSLWLVINLLLAYLPLGFARFYLRTLYFPLILLALPPLLKLFHLKGIFYKLIVLSVLCFTAFSSFFITYERIAEIKNHNPWYYLNIEESQALQFLRQNSSNGIGVLAVYYLGNIIPALTSNSVYFGHLLQTPQAADKIRNLTLFYGNKMSDSEAKSFLISNNIRFIVYRGEEQELSKSISQVNALRYIFLKEVLTKGDMKIYTY